ncbi:hypothetical protein Tco_0526153 [Tanacetum coccineum]
MCHALIEALIEDENAIDKGVADTFKDHKRKHDDDEDDDDEDPPGGPNQDKKTKRRRTKESESSKKPSITKKIMLVVRILSLDVMMNPSTCLFGMIVYLDDDEGFMPKASAFLYGKIKEEVYVCQPLWFEDPEFPDKMRPDRKYVDEILKKFGFSTVKTASTPMETSKPLLKDAKTEDVDVHLYRLKIGSLMYLIAFRPDIMFALCACARFQVTPKVSHLHDVKRIFRYLKGQPKLGLWYPKDSPFNLEAYTDNDSANASLDRKSTTGSSEYVAASSCCRQVLWIQHQMLDYGYNFMNTKIFINNESTICIVKNPVFYSKTKHIEIRHHFIRDSYEKRLIQVIKIHTDHNVADLLTKSFDVSRFQYLIANETVIKEWEDRMERAATTTSSLEAEQDSVQKKQRKDSSSTEPIPNKATNEEHVSTPSYDSPQSGEDRLLKKRVKQFEKRKKSRTLGLKRLRKVGSASRVESSNDVRLGAHEDASKQGRKITDLDVDAELLQQQYDELEQEKAKKKKGNKEEEEMKKQMEIVQDDEVAINAIPLATKPPMIVEYKIDKEGKMGYFKLIRADGSSKSRGKEKGQGGDKAFLVAKGYDRGLATFIKGLGAAVLIGLATLAGVAALEELCLAALISYYAVLVKTDVGSKIMFLLRGN